MALAQTIPDGVGSRYFQAVADVLARPRRMLGRHTTIERLLGWIGLAGLSALWLQATLVALRIHTLVSDYEAVHGPALDQWEGRAPRAPELEQLRLSLEGIHVENPPGLFFLWFFPISLLVLFGFWVGFSRWALAHRTVAWRRTFVVAAVVVAAQTILLYPAIDAFGWITN